MMVAEADESDGTFAFASNDIWHVDDNAHDPTHWKNSLYYFAQRIFHSQRLPETAATAAPANGNPR